MLMMILLYSHNIERIYHNPAYQLWPENCCKCMKEKKPAAHAMIQVLKCEKKGVARTGSTSFHNYSVMIVIQ